MDNKTHDFDEWFETLSMLLADEGGIYFTNKDSAREDYYSGRDVFDVRDEIAAEYQD
ncbi:hypothetical protein [Cerasicoccus frondis]|uniref:hypothetical protein n=1 Tax=Cerasicoccus frondis TaxID=490090 RepID=UPI0028528A20|nr:hypothetical protein [Cerasicoccus frondis]